MFLLTFAMLSMLANEKEIAMGRSINADLRDRNPALDDAQITAYVARIADRFRERSPVPLSVEVTRSADKRQFASLPGGFLRIPLGAIVQAETEVDLAITVAHAVAHLAKRHHIVRQQTGQTIPLIVWNFNHSDDALIPRAALPQVQKAEAEAVELASEWTKDYQATGEFEVIQNRAKHLLPAPRKRPTLHRTK